MKRTGRIFVFGLGYSAQVLARRLVADGWTVAGTARDDGSAGALAEHGIEVFAFAPEQPLGAAGRKALAGSSHLLSSVPPDADGDPVLDRHGAEIAGHGGLDWAGYLSTTGVYGDTGGAWVDEASPLRPTSGRGEHRVAAERAWLDLVPSGVPVHVFRLAGIYGPGRNAIEQLRAGTAKRISRPGHVFSRIHVDDIAATLRASIARPDPGAVYNVCDDRPAEAHEVTRFAAELIGVEPPPLVAYDDALLSAMARSFWADRRRVRNDRIKDELGVRLAYPDFEAGLRAILAAEQG